MEQATDTNQATETHVAEATAETQTQTADTTQSAPETKAFDPNNIPAEIQEHFKKQYGDYEQLKQEVGQFRQLTQDQRFQKWYQEINSPQAPQKFEISAEEHAAALGDPAKFQELVMRAAEFNASKLSPQIQQLQSKLEFEQRKSEIADVQRRYPEFRELDSRGLIEPIIRRYEGRISFLDAMNIAKSESGWVAKQVDDKARGQVQLQRRAITEKGGNSSNAKAKKTFSNRTEAMEYAYAEAQAGREVDPDDIEIS